MWMLNLGLRWLPTGALIGFVACAMVATGVAQTPAASDPVARATVALYEGIQETTLSNGLRVILKPIPEAPTVSVMTVYRVGSADEELNQTGLAHYLEHLMFKGTRRLMPGDIDRLTRRAGGRNNAYTTFDFTNYFFDFASGRWDTALRIEADRMRHLQIDEQHEFQQEKGAVIAELDGNEDLPYDLENKAILPLLFGEKSPYGHPIIGEKQHVRGVDAETIKAFYDRWYHPNNAAIIMVGGFDASLALTRIKELFGPIPAGKLPERPRFEGTARQQSLRFEIPSRFETERLVMGFTTCRLGEPDDHVLDVIEAILSGGKTGRLYRTLVLDQQVAAEVACANQSGRHAGWFSIEMEISKGTDCHEAEKALLAELERLANEPISEAELQRVERRVVANMVFSHEDPHSLADSLAHAFATAGLDYLRNYLPRIRAVTPADVLRVARKYLHPDRRVVVASVLPKKPESASTSSTRSGAVRAVKEHQVMARSPRPGRHTPRRLPFREPPADPWPVAGGGPNLKAMQRRQLDNGLTLLLLPQRRLPIIYAQAHVARVRLYEPAEQSGLAAFVGMMLEEGTTRRSEKEIAEAIDNMGGILSLSATGGSVKVLTPDRAKGLDLLIDCLSRPAFPADAIKRIKEHQLAEIEDQKLQPEARAREEFMRIIYGEHPLGRPFLGTTASVEKFDAEACRQFHRAVFVPNNTVLAIVGDFDPDEMVKMVQDLTKDWVQRDLPKVTRHELPMPAAQQRIISLPKSSQLNIYLGHLGIRRLDPDYYRLLVMDHILGVGTGFTDRLSSRLRDRQGLAYTVSASITASAGEEPGVLSAFVGTYPNQLATVTTILNEEIRRIRDEVPPAREVEEAKDYLIATMGFQWVTVDSIAAQLIHIDRFGLGEDYLADFQRAIAAVTPQEVQAAARRHLHPNRLVVVAAGPVTETGEPIPSHRP
jgi:zinc protease